MDTSPILPHLSLVLPRAGWAVAGALGILWWRERSRRLHASEDLRAATEARKGLESRLLEGRRLESIGILAGGLVHDLNNVLMAIRHHAESLEAQGVELSAPSLEAIRSGCARASGMTGGLLRLARRGGGGREAVDLNVVVADTLRLMAPGALKGIEVILELQEPLPRVLGDAGALGNAFMNLCLNAADASAPGAPVTVRTCTDGQGWVCLCVRDQGCGMGEEVARRALEPFFTTKPPGKGTGLGLAMVGSTLAEHGGTLALASRQGQGTEVLLTLPPADAPAETEPKPSALLKPMNTLEALRVLVVDDDPDLRSALCPLLASLGHQVLEAAGGGEALRLVQEGLEVDLVLLDVEMPGLGGLQTLQGLRALRPALPVLLASGHDEAEVAGMIREAGGVAAIQKPFSLERFQERAQGLVGRPGS